MTGLPQELRRVTLGASYGDAFLAAQAIGAADAEAIDRWNPPVGCCDPRPVPAYETHWRIFRALYERTKDLMRLRPGDGGGGTG
ncbi:hypothetical protein ruthe_00828 [Rubellimicrobium thermophilum DSM 16684]|uniref:Sugar (Pentulose and hexulose) kinase n=1 Tax=Rubellimicrobium thermophilum DSM 16684 TaxID=1123069 RepID=S9R5I5_9RHOB|nr:hypothetical protein [Rubellimicrobium thermophilum]EPX87157.1 hypothetical protein ruthe_00828 [Rubellimicrobium thermophilum DSM 16684]